MPLTGDTKALAEMRRRVAHLSSPDFRRRVLTVIGHEALSRSLACFVNSKDPYGVRWKPLKIHRGMPLRDKGLLMNSINVRVSDAGFELATDRKGAQLHQNGGTIVPKNAKALRFMVGNRAVFAKKVVVPARPFFPDARGMPRAWSAAFKGVAHDFIRAQMGHNARSRTLRTR